MQPLQGESWQQRKDLGTTENSLLHPLNPWEKKWVNKKCNYSNENFSKALELTSSPDSLLCFLCTHIHMEKWTQTYIQLHAFMVKCFKYPIYLNTRATSYTKIMLMSSNWGQVFQDYRKWTTLIIIISTSKESAKVFQTLIPNICSQIPRSDINWSTNQLLLSSDWLAEDVIGLWFHSSSVDKKTLITKERVLDLKKT